MLGARIYYIEIVVDTYYLISSEFFNEIQTKNGFKN